MSGTTDTATNYHWAIIVGSVVGGLGLAGSLVTIMISLTLGNAAVPTGLSGISSSLAVGGLLLAIVRIAARPKWAVDRMDALDKRMDAQDAKLDTIVAAVQSIEATVAQVKLAVNTHADHVAREHGGLHDDAVDVGEQLAELRALVADMRHKLQPEPEQAEQQQRHVPKQRKRHRRQADGDNVLPLPAESIRAARRLASRVIKSEEQRVEDNREDKS